MPSDRIRRNALIVWTLVGAIVLGWVFLIIAEAIRVIWLPIAFAAGIVFLLDPLVKMFERLRMPRIVGAILSLLIMIAAIVAVGALVWPAIQEQGTELIQQLPDLYVNVVEWARDFAANVFGINIDDFLSQQAIEEWLRDPANQETIQNLLFGFGAGAGVVLRGVAETIAVIALAPVLAIYILMDLSRFQSQALEMTPPRHRPEVAYVGGEVGTAMGSFVRGQLLVAFIVGVASSFGMWAIGLPFWLLIGIIAGFLNLIPFLGPVVGGALAALVALLNGDVWQAVWAVVIMIVIQQIDNHLITPMVQRARVNLSPLVIVLALIIGGTLAGLLGVLVAIPVTAAIRILVGHLWRTRILGQSWEEASEAMIEVTEPPERLARLRRSPEQSRLFDTQEIRKLEDDAGVPETAPADKTV
ncbi:MAG TPA: AI-2E family transporter [Acidimicrobiia bacterium]|nr:AI-2E family transporter [Acidimicrobiia bacterium]